MQNMSNWYEVPSTGPAYLRQCLIYLRTAAVEECVKGATLQIGSTTITPVKPTATITLDTCGEEGSDRDEAEADDDDMEQGTSDEEVINYTSFLNGIARLCWGRLYLLLQV
jgi:hypothetical protein